MRVELFTNDSMHHCSLMLMAQDHGFYDILSMTMTRVLCLNNRGKNSFLSHITLFRDGSMWVLCVVIYQLQASTTPLHRFKVLIDLIGMLLLSVYLPHQLVSTYRVGI